jgi:hypothetical protein
MLKKRFYRQGVMITYLNAVKHLNPGLLFLPITKQFTIYIILLSQIIIFTSKENVAHLPSLFRIDWNDLKRNYILPEY